ncbi:transcription factor bHLH113-like isoform X2 [Magnolia sinica]|nr:transcription factor bHLH113-like isoform X2 [Magnolia sinica]
MQDFGFSGMRKAIFPSFSSPFCSLGNNDVPMPISNVSTMELERLNSYNNSGLFLEPQVSNDLQLGSFTPLSTIEISQAFDYQSGAGAGGLVTSMHENTSLPKLPCRISFHEDAIQNAKKRTVMDDLMNKEIAMKESKKRKAIYTEEFHHQTSDESSSTHQLKAPARRSNKLGDRVTALQQLVSPFGKTDTASVLQEATVHIKLLQDQIQVLSTPYFRIRPPHHPRVEGEEKTDLRSRGLCLVPVSSTVNLAKEDIGINRSNPTGRTVFPRF